MNEEEKEVRPADMSPTDFRVWCMNWVAGRRKKGERVPTMAELIQDADELYSYIASGDVPSEDDE